MSEDLSPIHKIALSIYATTEERSTFDSYQDTVKRAGWSVLPVPASELEELAFVVVHNNKKGKARAAAYLAEFMLNEALRGVCCE